MFGIFGFVVLVSVVGPVEHTLRVINASFFALFRYFEKNVGNGMT
jgi:hypothetical protein